MRNNIIAVIVLVVFFGGIVAMYGRLTSWVFTNLEKNTTQKVLASIEAQQTMPQPDDWQLFKQALIEVESGGDTTAEGKTNDKGLFQITPIYIDEVNRILGQNKYAHNDAYDPDLSDYFFELIQSTHNPNKELKKALILHNPNAMNEHTMSYYEYKVMYNFYKLKCEWYEGL